VHQISLSTRAGRQPILVLGSGSHAQPRFPPDAFPVCYSCSVCAQDLVGAMSSARNRALGSFFSAFHVARQCFSLLLVPRIKALTPLGLCTRIHFTAEYYCQGLSFAAALTFVFSPAHSQGSRSVLAPFLAAAIVMFCSHDFGRQ
jgi:hypothetical protein